MSARLQSLRPASFRDVPFEVDDAGFEGGRRVQLHEYPQRDKPFAEDLGRSARGITFTAFVVGDDYLARAQALIRALETAGPGTLIHPWLGTLQVSIKDAFRVRYSRTAVGVASFELSFVEAGELAFPSAGASTASAARLAADALSRASSDDFAGGYLTQGVPDFVAAATVANWRKVLSALSVPTPGLESIRSSNKLADLTSAVLDTATDPSVIPTRLIDALGLRTLVHTSQRWDRIVQGLLRVLARREIAVPAPTVYTTQSRIQAAQNVVATNALVRRTLIAEAVAASSLMPVVVVDDAVAIRSALLSVIDAESLVAPDPVYQHLQTARSAVWSDITARARNAARLRYITPKEPLPALVLAYELYVDTERADEIVQRNRVRHPGFVPARPLLVLSA